MNDTTQTDNHDAYDVKTDIQSNTPLAPQRAHLQLAIEGMTCQACASRIEKVSTKSRRYTR